MESRYISSRYFSEKPQNRYISSKVKGLNTIVAKERPKRLKSEAYRYFKMRFFFQCLFTQEHAELVNHRFVKVQGN